MEDNNMFFFYVICTIFADDRVIQGTQKQTSMKFDSKLKEYFTFKTIDLKMLFAKWQHFVLTSMNVIIQYQFSNPSDGNGYRVDMPHKKIFDKRHGYTAENK